MVLKMLGNWINKLQSRIMDSLISVWNACAWVQAHYIYFNICTERIWTNRLHTVNSGYLWRTEVTKKRIFKDRVSIIFNQQKSVYVWFVGPMRLASNMHMLISFLATSLHMGTSTHTEYILANHSPSVMTQRKA